MKNCKISNILCLIYGIIFSLISISCLVYYFALDMLEKEAGKGTTPVEGFASVLAYVAAILMVVFGVIILINGIVYIILSITGFVAVKRKSIKGQKVNGIFKIVIIAIELLIFIPIMFGCVCSVFESVVYQSDDKMSCLISLLISVILVMFNCAIFMFSYLQIEDSKKVGKNNANISSGVS